MKEKLKNILFFLYVIIAVFVTVCLLSYNEMKVTEFGDNSLVIIDNEELEPEYQKGDLLIVNKSSAITRGENVFFYSTYNRKIDINLAKVENIERVNEHENSYTLEGERKVSGEYVLGSTRTTTVIPKLGMVLGILESKWGFLFLIILPALLAFLNQIAIVFSQVRGKDED